MRRVRHRISQAGIEDHGDHIGQLQVNADEFSALFNTILINVTAFFRDPEARSPRRWAPTGSASRSRSADVEWLANEELQNVNDALRERTAELDQVNEFLESILTSLRAGSSCWTSR